jgi:cytochrome c oxidase subunit 4
MDTFKTDNPLHREGPLVHSSEGAHLHIPRETYVKIFLALMLLLVITVAAAFIPFARWGLGPLGVVITFLIATVKAYLVVMYFMHVKHGTRLTKVFVLGCLLWLAILMALTLADYLSRSWTPLSSGWQPEKQLPAP